MRRISIVQWLSPITKKPADANYVLICQKDEDGLPLCFEGSYEKGCFWYPVSGAEEPINISTIIGWAYLPYSRN